MKGLNFGSTKGPKELETTSAAKNADFTNNKAKRGGHKPRAFRSQPEMPVVSPVTATPATEPKPVDKANTREAYQFQAKAEPGAVPASPKSHRRSIRSRRTSQAGSVSSPPASKTTPWAHQLASEKPALPSKTKTEPPYEEATEQLYRYVVQGRNNGEEILGVYNTLERANEQAREYVVQRGVPACDIVDLKSSFGQKAYATRRCWGNGMSEIKVVKGKGIWWIKVLPKGFVASGIGGRVFLALDKSESLFVIGVYGGKEVWLAYSRYEEQLAYCCEVEGGGSGLLERRCCMPREKLGEGIIIGSSQSMLWMRGLTCEFMNLVAHGT